jgi:hypothetical protein
LAFRITWTASSAISFTISGAGIDSFAGAIQSPQDEIGAERPVRLFTCLTDEPAHFICVSPQEGQLAKTAGVGDGRCHSRIGRLIDGRLNDGSSDVQNPAQPSLQ